MNLIQLLFLNLYNDGYSISQVRHNSSTKMTVKDELGIIWSWFILTFSMLQWWVSWWFP